MSNEINYSASDLMPKDVESQRILHERAHRLAKSEIKTASSNTINYIQFKLKDELYGIPYSFAKEVIQNVSLTHMPCVPDFVAGVINRRGILLTLIDLKQFFQLENQVTTNKCAYIIVVSNKTMTVGLLVDQIKGSNAYDPVTIDMPLVSSTAVKTEYIIGLYHGNTAIINIENILSSLKKILP